MSIFYWFQVGTVLVRPIGKPCGNGSIPSTGGSLSGISGASTRLTGLRRSIPLWLHCPEKLCWLLTASAASQLRGGPNPVSVASNVYRLRCWWRLPISLALQVPYRRCPALCRLHEDRFRFVLSSWPVEMTHMPPFMPPPISQRHGAANWWMPASRAISMSIPVTDRGQTDSNTFENSCLRAGLNRSRGFWEPPPRYCTLVAGMRTISKRTQYGLKAMLALASRYGEGPILIATLSKQEGIPIKFLELILLDLKNSSLLDSKKGPKGGYQLSRPPSTITVGSLIRIMEGRTGPTTLRQRDGIPPM